MDLSNYSLPELRRLAAKIENEIRRRSDTTRRNLLKRVQKMAAEEGLTLDDRSRRAEGFNNCLLAAWR